MSEKCPCGHEERDHGVWFGCIYCGCGASDIEDDE